MNNLERFRKMRGLTQEDLADVLGVSPSKISRAESEHDSAMLDTYKRAAEYFGVPLSAIFSDERGPAEQEVLQILANLSGPRLEQALAILRLSQDLPPRDD